MARGLKKLIASALIGSLIILPGVLLAQERRGAMVVVTRKTGGQVAGELIAVRQDSLLLLSPVGKDESVDIPDIWTIEIVRKHKAGSGFLIGFLAGGIAGGVLGSQWNKGDSSYKGVVNIKYFSHPHGKDISHGLGKDVSHLSRD